MLAAEIGDPRLQALFGACDAGRASVRPVVQLPRKGISPALFGITLVAAAITLFLVLNERRARQMQPAVQGAGSELRQNESLAPPTLWIPPAQESFSNARSEGVRASPQRPLRIEPSHLRSVPRAQPAPPQQLGIAPPPSMPPLRPVLPVRPDTPILIEGGAGTRVPRPIPGGSSSELSADRERASTLANPSFTVPQGTLIPAVLETAFDSTRPGFSRAIVSSDVRSFDRKNVLIPRGSRLIGESKPSTVDGQKSVAITWTRVLRPDGVTIEMDAPTADMLGRGGATASVDTHFFSGVGSLVSSVFDTFSQILAARAGPLLILPGSASIPKPHTGVRPKRAPTLKVASGTSINVFVAHDLDFSATEASQ